MHAITAASVLLGLACATAGASAQDRELAKTHYDIAIAELNKGETRRALRELLSSIERDPYLVEAHHALGMVYHELGRLEDGLEHYAKAVELRPGFSDAHNNMGTLLIAMGRYDDAIVAFDKALADILYATPSLAEGNKGWALHLKGDDLAALRHLKNAVATNPKFCRGYEWLARVGLDQNTPAEVTDSCKRFERYCLADARIAAQIGQAYRREMGYYCGLGHLGAGDRDAARDAFGSCADPEDDVGFGQRCADSLATLEPAAAP